MVARNLLCLLALAGIIGCQQHQNSKSELIGNWRVISTDNGDGPARRDGVVMEITEKSIVLRASNGGAKKMGDIERIDAASDPKEIDLRNGKEVGFGIYVLDGDNLKLIICDPGRPHPKKLQGSRHGILFSLQRDAK